MQWWVPRGTSWTVTSKLTGRDPEKLSGVVATWNKLNLTPSANRTTAPLTSSWSEYRRRTDSWGGAKKQLTTPPQWGWKTLHQRKNELLEAPEIIFWKKGQSHFLKGWEMGHACLLDFSPGLANSLDVQTECALHPDSSWAAGPSKACCSSQVPSRSHPAPLSEVNDQEMAS